MSDTTGRAAYDCDACDNARGFVWQRDWPAVKGMDGVTDRCAFICEGCCDEALFSYRVSTNGAPAITVEAMSAVEALEIGVDRYGLSANAPVYVTKINQTTNARG